MQEQSQPWERRTWLCLLSSEFCLLQEGFWVSGIGHTIENTFNAVRRDGAGSETVAYHRGTVDGCLVCGRHLVGDGLRGHHRWVVFVTSFVVGAWKCEAGAVGTRKVVKDFLQCIQVEVSLLFVVDEADAEGTQDAEEVLTTVAWEEANGVAHLDELYGRTHGELSWSCFARCSQESFKCRLVNRYRHIA